MDTGETKMGKEDILFFPVAPKRDFCICQTEIEKKLSWQRNFKHANRPSDGNGTAHVLDFKHRFKCFPRLGAVCTVPSRNKLQVCSKPVCSTKQSLGMCLKTKYAKLAQQGRQKSKVDRARELFLAKPLTHCSKCSLAIEFSLPTNA